MICIRRCINFLCQKVEKTRPVSLCDVFSFDCSVTIYIKLLWCYTKSINAIVFRIISQPISWKGRRNTFQTQQSPISWMRIWINKKKTNAHCLLELPRCVHVSKKPPPLVTSSSFRLQSNQAIESLGLFEMRYVSQQNIQLERCWSSKVIIKRKNTIIHHALHICETYFRSLVSREVGNFQQATTYNFSQKLNFDLFVIHHWRAEVLT